MQLASACEDTYVVVSGPPGRDGHYESTKPLLVLVPHGQPHGTMRFLENPCMLLPTALKVRANQRRNGARCPQHWWHGKHTMCIRANVIGTLAKRISG